MAPLASSAIAALAGLVTLLASSAPAPALARGFLVDRPGFRGGATGGAEALERELAEAMGEALGCGGQVGPERLLQLERKLEPMWRTLPKNDDANIERRSLRYLVHRHFSREAALHIRGFEPSRPANASGWGEADILGQRVPGFVESVLESQHRLQKGFSLHDAARVVATLEQLISDSEAAILHHVYETEGRPASQTLDGEDLGQLLESYMVYWMLGDDEETADLLLENRSLLEVAIPHWTEIAGFVSGQVKALEHRRQTSPRAASTTGARGNALSPVYSFEDAHSVVTGITNSFASYWESECSAMKAQLVDMDPQGTGRVPLAKFYGTGLDADWRFGESEEYLRELGALDETSWVGKQVIIPNYIQAASNCIVASEHYRVCCINDCEALLEDIEREIGAPTAPPAAILAVVGNLSSHISVDDDEPPYVFGPLAAQLEQIAEQSPVSEVPLHGRLFAQWLHFAYPRECPFPHVAGAVASATPSEFGERHVASDEEMRRLASEADRTDFVAHLDKEELQWMSQWSPEEELLGASPLASSPSASSSSTSSLGLVLIGALLLALGAALGVVRVSAGGAAGALKGRADAVLLPSYQKEHFV